MEHRATPMDPSLIGLSTVEVFDAIAARLFPSGAATSTAPEAAAPEAGGAAGMQSTIQFCQGMERHAQPPQQQLSKVLQKRLGAQTTAAPGVWPSSGGAAARAAGGRLPVGLSRFAPEQGTAQLWPNALNCDSFCTGFRLQQRKAQRQHVFVIFIP